MTDRRSRIEINPSRRRLLRGIGALSATTLLAGCDWTTSQTVQDVLGKTQWLSHDAMRLVTSQQALAPTYPKRMISPVFQANGTIEPMNANYQQLKANNFANYQLGIHGEVQRPQKFSLQQIRAMPSLTQITRMDCVEGWSVIGGFTGVTLSHLLALARPTSNAKYVVFHCADFLNAPQPYYESLSIEQAHQPQTVLAYELNGQPLPVHNGAPLRLRAPRQLGYKNAKYVMHLELVSSFAHIQGGRGGYWEDRGYNWFAGI